MLSEVKLLSVNLTDQEQNIVNYLENRTDMEVAWEELAQFAKDPFTVKLKTIQKTVSEIKRKYKQVGLPHTFNVHFKSLSTKTVPQHTLNVSPITKQTLVQVKKTIGGNVVPSISSKTDAQIDFSLDSLGFKRVNARSGTYQLNDNEWEMFKYFYNNTGRIITISELRDKVMYPSYGSKLPARWFDSIMRVINNLRRQVFGLDKRLLTVKGTETSYLFQ